MVTGVLGGGGDGTGGPSLTVSSEWGGPLSSSRHHPGLQSPPLPKHGISETQEMSRFSAEGGRGKEESPSFSWPGWG